MTLTLDQLADRWGCHRTTAKRRALELALQGRAEVVQVTDAMRERLELGARVKEVFRIEEPDKPLSAAGASTPKPRMTQ